MMNEYKAWNRPIIEEFRANGGQVGGPYAGVPLLLLTTTGAKSGQQRFNPLAYHADGERLVVIASKAGAPSHPDWYHNLVAHPDVTVEVGTETFEARASVVQGAQRDELYANRVALMPNFAAYQAKVTRTIPVVVLTRKE
jgi:deazaflavin-dependent oxidoreductase (nitroreductase family)